ncbi:carboxymuconolactone decarboxylase family protein [Allopontixanthobacter sp.]|uniref:carboxymuconolactone decarboxylase family protein n=1 Tax=Allopontixanthobacter sp. TaxID=2906452 RepID=UPI002AB91ADA|nr:carboxymuconolactone decarboxylase family protein [Allopontixanthobacter sp.]MDZ4307030.1 carboxymuconolactone decarboxylase family protein [Allopontixanthobacter sp.]
MDSVFKLFPATVGPLLEYHDRVLRDPSPLTVAERELIAAYVSGLNACTYCHGSHVLAATAFGIDENWFEGLINDLESCAVDAKLKPLLAYVRKLTLTPSMIVEADAAAVYAAGWEEQALFDAISVCGLFNLMNRIVDGTGTRIDPLVMPEEDKTARRARMVEGVDPGDPYRAERSYSKLAAIWGIAP